MTGCCLVAWNLKVISTDLEHRLKSVVTVIFYCINKTLLVSFVVHRRKSLDRFRICDKTLVQMFYFLINKLFQWKTVVTLYVLKDSFPFSL